MTFTVSPGVKKTTKCKHNFSCLETGNCGDRSICEVEYANGDPVLFLKTTEGTMCRYRVNFANKQVCMCPTHYQIYTQQKQASDGSGQSGES